MPLIRDYALIGRVAGSSGSRQRPLCQPGSLVLSLILPAGFLAVAPLPAPLPALSARGRIDRVSVQSRAGFHAASPIRRPETTQEAKSAPRQRLRRGISHPARRRPQRRSTPFFLWLPEVPNELVKEDPWEVVSVLETLDSNGEREQIRGPPAFTRDLFD